MSRKLSVEERADLIKKIVNKKLLPVLSRKGTDYSRYIRNDDKNRFAANASFGGVANLLKGREGVDEYVVWFVFLVKHFQAIASWVCERELISEKIEGRFVDAINYLLIGWTMLIEDGIINPRGLEE